MKKYTLLTIALLAATIQLKAQDTTLTKKVKNLENQIERIKKVLSDNEKDRTVDVGVIKLKKTKNIAIYNYNDDKASAQVDVDSVRIISKDGYIVHINIFTKDTGQNIYLFYNHKSPIELAETRLSRIEKLSNGNHQYIKLADILMYSTLKKSIPSNSNILLTPSDPSYTYNRAVGLNTIFDLRLYTDALALFGEKSNGLVQADASFKQILNRANIPQTGVFLGNYFKFNFTASKFDSKIGFTDSAKFSRTSLYQKSFINADASINLISGWIEKRSVNFYYLDFGGGISLSNLAKKTDTTSLASHYFFLESGISYQVSDNFGMALYGRLIWHYNYSTDVDQNLYIGRMTFVKPTFTIYWNPVDDSASKLFGRISYVISPSEKSKNFAQFQIGYSIRLSEFAKNVK